MGISCTWLSLRGIALDPAAGKIYWVTDHYDVGWGLQRANLDGSDVEDAFAINADEVGGLALDLPEGKIYWTAIVDNPEGAGHLGTVQRADLDGSDLETVTADSAVVPVSGIALDLRASGDCDHDDAITLADYAELAGCMAGPAGRPPAGCGCVNLNGDECIDLADFAALQTTFTGR